MKNIIQTICILVAKIDMDNLINQYPQITDSVNELVDSIRKSQDITQASHMFDLLEILVMTLASLRYKHNFELIPDHVELLQYERLDDPDFRLKVYKQIKMGEILSGLKVK